jgi:serine protease Do
MKKPTLIPRLLLCLLACIMASVSCKIFDGDDLETIPTPTSTLASSGPVVSPSPQGAVQSEITIPDLARATVQILALVRVGNDFQAIWSGSGSIIDSRGLVLTNAHVVDDRFDEYTDIGIAMIERTDQAPDLSYLASIVTVDYDLDLAVIQIRSDLDGDPVSLDLPTVALGNSDQVELGGTLRILGYPGIGGQTITFTEGAISGFTTERGIDGRAWIKTDATIAGGNSGGMAVDSQGRLIGIPTRVSSGDARGDIVDCRAVVDTNRDGVIDSQDTCVPLGGFINGLRPVNLAMPLIEAALAGQQYISGDIAQPAGGYDLSDTYFYNLVFSAGVTADDQPLQVMDTLPSGSTELCVFWDYEGMANGMEWSAIWFIDRELSELGSIINDSWGGGEAGNWWACIYDDSGLDDGLFEVILEAEGQSLASESIFVGGYRTHIDFTLVNQSSQAICYAYLSPSMAQNWGQDELGPQEIVYSGTSSTFALVTGEYDIFLLNCADDELAEEYRLDIFEDMTYTLTD